MRKKLFHARREGRKDTQRGTKSALFHIAIRNPDRRRLDSLRYIGGEKSACMIALLSGNMARVWYARLWRAGG
jgi:hypothetical protein